MGVMAGAGATELGRTNVSVMAIDPFSKQEINNRSLALALRNSQD
jgi:hypothetical protein